MNSVDIDNEIAEMNAYYDDIADSDAWLNGYSLENELLGVGVVK